MSVLESATTVTTPFAPRYICSKEEETKASSLFKFQFVDHNLSYRGVINWELKIVLLLLEK